MSSFLAIKLDISPEIPASPNLSAMLVTLVHAVVMVVQRTPIYSTNLGKNANPY